MLEEQGFNAERSTIMSSRAAYNLFGYGIINAVVNAKKEHQTFVMKQELF